MSTEAESVPATSSSNAPSARPKKKKKKGAKKKLMRPLTEQEINAPDMQTLIMLGCLTAMTITLWAFAHAGCNYHPPRETRRPRDVTTAELTRDPKDAAIEFQHRLLLQNYKGALEIAAGSAVDTVKQEQAKCEANKDACAKLKARLGVAVTAATVLERTPANAKVRVTNYHLPTGDQSYLALVEREAGGWKVTARVPDAPGATLPQPSLPAPPPIRFNVAPAGSAGEMRLVPGDHPPTGSPAPTPSVPPHAKPVPPSPAPLPQK
jgi:hypothetical protein